jgi:hypothetical protein
MFFLVWYGAYVLPGLVWQDVTELTKLLTTGGGSQVTMERLERSIAQLREMFTTRSVYFSVLFLLFSLNFPLTFAFPPSYLLYFFFSETLSQSLEHA